LENKELFEGKPVLEFDNDYARRNFFKWAGIIGVGSTLAAAGATNRFSASAQGGGDLDILNYALTLEYLEAEFYKQGVAAGVVSGREEELIIPIEAHEAAHVAAITATIEDLGGQPVAAPGVKFPGPTFKSRDAFLETASTFEELGVTAYHGQVTLIENVDILAAAASIAGVESRHAAVIASLIGGNPFPAPVEDTATMAQVLKAAQPFIK